jgi:hypothetical protein
MPVKPEKLKKFEDKFELVNGEWKAKLGGNWQTKKPPIDLPKDPNGEVPEWMANIRLWALEMNQWANVVHKELIELRTEVDTLKQNAPAPRPGAPAAPVL